MRHPIIIVIFLLLNFSAGDISALAEAPLSMQSCESIPQPAFCSAVRGARSEGWPAQSRSEVMAQHGMVVTSQPLAAQAGLQILRRGGNAIDAAVATAAALNVTEPMMVGMGGDLFAKHVAGYYRAGSDFRKDGEAVGW